MRFKRPGYLFGCGTDTSKPGNLGDESIEARNAIHFFEYSSPLPPELETGYIPDYMKYSASFPYSLIDQVNRFNPGGSVMTIKLPKQFSPLKDPKMFPPLRDPKTFNILMV